MSLMLAGLLSLTDDQRRARFNRLRWRAMEEDRFFDLTSWEDVCPQCGLADDLDHLAECPRCGTCGQTIPYLDPPFHPDPPEIYRRRDDESFSEAVDRMREYGDRHRREHQAAEVA